MDGRRAAEHLASAGVQAGPGGLGSARPATISAILSARIWEACTAISARDAGPLPILAEPEFADGSIGHGLLLDRLACWQPGASGPPRNDLEVALLRLAPETDESFWARWARLPVVTAGAAPSADAARRRHAEGHAPLGFDVLNQELGLEYALASRRLYTDGAEVLYDYAQQKGDTPEGESARELVVVRNNQRVFNEVVELYLRRVDFAPDGYAQLIRLPQYKAAEVAIDPDHAFGRPKFVRSGAGVDDVIDLFRAGEPVDVVAEEFGLSRDEVEDAIRVSTRPAAYVLPRSQPWPQSFAP